MSRQASKQACSRKAFSRSHALEGLVSVEGQIHKCLRLSQNNFIIMRNVFSKNQKLFAPPSPALSPFSAYFAPFLTP